MSVVATILGIVGGIFVAKGDHQPSSTPPAPGSPTVDTVLMPRTVVDGVPRRRRHHAGVGDHPGPPGGQDPAGRGDASRARLRGAQRQAARRRRRSSRVVGAVAFVRRPVRPPGRHDRHCSRSPAAARLLIFLGVASVSSTVARPVTKLIGWPVAKVFRTPGRAGPGERRAGAAAHVGDGGGADDRRGPGQRGGGVRRVAAAHVLGRSSSEPCKADYIITDESFQGLPPAVAETLAQLPELSAVTADPRRPGARSTATSKAIGAADPPALRAARRHRHAVEGSYRGPGRRRHPRPQGPGEGPRPAGRRHRRR